MDRVGMKIKWGPAGGQEWGLVCKREVWTTWQRSHREERGNSMRLDAIFAGTSVAKIEPLGAPMVGIWEQKEEPSKKTEDRPGK